jgi:hypothetical protein
MLNDNGLNVRADEVALERRWPQTPFTMVGAVTSSAVEVVEADVLQRPAHADDPDKPQRGTGHD